MHIALHTTNSMNAKYSVLENNRNSRFKLKPNCLRNLKILKHCVCDQKICT